MPEISKKSENFLGSYVFSYTSFEAFVEKDIIHNHIGTPTIKFNIDPDKNAPIKFGYAPQYGLVKFNNTTGSIEDNNVLGDLISIKNNDSNKLIKFFSKYGFLFHVERYNSTKYDQDELFKIINHLKWTTELMWQLCDNRSRNYEHLVKLIFKLVFSGGIIIKDARDKTVYSKSRNSLYSKLDSFSGGNYIESQLQPYYMEDEFNIEKSDFTVHDNIYGDIKVKFEDFENELNYKGHRTLTTIAALHYDNNENKTGDKNFWDFLYHFFKYNESSILLGFKYGDVSSLDNYKCIIKDEFKDIILKIGKHVLAEEITINISNVRPYYDQHKLEPGWKVPNLLTALYLSLFYMKPNVELIRKCQNPNCNNYFKVSTSATRTKYCCTNCGNAVAQAKYRNKQKYINLK